MQRTKIEWVKNTNGSRGFTWNPVTGCLAGCTYCYARVIAEKNGHSDGIDSRVRPRPQIAFIEQGSFPYRFTPTFYPGRIKDPLLEIKKPSTIFVCSMADLFGPWIPEEWRKKIFHTVELCPQHTFLFLTKYPHIMAQNLGQYLPSGKQKNHWFGYTDDGTRAKSDWIYLKFMSNVFVSCEPLLGDSARIKFEHIDWLIIGALTRDGRPVPPKRGGTQYEWVIKLIQEARRYNVLVFVKNNLLTIHPSLPDIQEVPWIIKNKSHDYGQPSLDFNQGILI